MAFLFNGDTEEEEGKGDLEAVDIFVFCGWCNIVD